MSRPDLEMFAANVVISLYGESSDDDGNLHDELQLNQDKEWDGDTIESVAEDIANQNLNPDKL